MKKILQSFFCVVLAILMFSSQAVAYTSIAAINSEAELSAVADFDEAEIYAAFNEVEALITTIESTNLTYADLEASNSDLISDVSASAAIAMSSASADTPPFISAFLWGCIFNLAGMLIVGITTEFDSDQLRKSAWGCLISSLLWGGTSIYTY
jgi:hypothetical protein